MEQSTIFGPFFTVILLTIIVWVFMYTRRISFIRKSNLSPGQLSPAEFARISPPSVSNPSDNLKNLFEIPTIFYALCLYLYVTNNVDTTFVTAAWVFAIFRIGHSAVHCTANIVMLRFFLYCISTISLWLIVVRSVLQAWGVLA